MSRTCLFNNGVFSVEVDGVLQAVIYLNNEYYIPVGKLNELLEFLVTNRDLSTLDWNALFQKAVSSDWTAPKDL